MKTLMALLIAIVALLSGCVVYDTPSRDGAEGRGDHQRDRDYDRRGRDDRGTRNRDEHDERDDDAHRK